MILEVRDLVKDFAARDGGTTRALDRISFRAHRREIMCVIGPSGCGKSTLARILAGLDEPTAGQVLLDGKQVSGPGPDRGMVFQGYTLFPWLTVTKNVMFGLELSPEHSRSSAEEEARDWIELVGLRKFADAYPHQLSGGMKQRVAIARALAPRPAHPADGRAVRRARRADARADAVVPAADLEAGRRHHRLHHPRSRRGGLPGRSHPRAGRAPGTRARADGGAGAAAAHARAISLAHVHGGAPPSSGADPPARRRKHKTAFP